MTRPVSFLLGAAALIAAAQPALAADAAQAPASQVPGRLRVFEDWAVGCDNLLNCAAVALKPDGSGDAYAVLVRVRRAGGPAGETALDLIGAGPLPAHVALVVDGMDILQLPSTGERVHVEGADALRLARLLGSSYAFEIRADDTMLDAPSLNGLPMALRYIDEQQGRIGSEAALAAIGDRPADQARSLPEAIGMTGPPAPAAAEPPPLEPAERAAARRLAACASHPPGDAPLAPHWLDEKHALVLLPCKAGSANAPTVPLVASGRPGAWTFALARFDRMPGATDSADSPPLIVNPRWDRASAQLSSVARGRPRGDCGTSETYRWDGTLFRLVEARAMPVCRGAWVWPVLWRMPVTAAP